MNSGTRAYEWGGPKMCPSMRVCRPADQTIDSTILSMRRPLLLFIAVLLAAFVASYPYLDGMGLCVSGGCPDAQQASSAISGGLSGACLLVAVLGSTPAVVAFALFRGSPFSANRHPTQLYFSPEPPPPRDL